MRRGGCIRELQARGAREVAPACALRLRSFGCRGFLSLGIELLHAAAGYGWSDTAIGTIALPLMHCEE